MSQVTVTVTVPASADAREVTAARTAFVDTLTSNYGAGRKYAATLVGFFRAAGFGDDWLTMAHDAKGEAGDAMRTERDALYAGLKGAGHSNPSVKWKQIKGYALDLIKAEAGEDDTDEASEGEGNAKHTRSPQLRMVEDLTALYKMCKRESKTLTDAQRKASLHIGAALADLGVDISTL